MQRSVIEEIYKQLLFRDLKERYPCLSNLENLLPDAKRGYERKCRVYMIDLSAPSQDTSFNDPDRLLEHLEQAKLADTHGHVH